MTPQLAKALASLKMIRAEARKHKPNPDVIHAIAAAAIAEIEDIQLYRKA